MSFLRYDENNLPIRHRAVIDCSEDKILTEQSHKKEVNINEIVKRHGVDLIQKTSQLASASFQFDDVTGNDFQEAMQKITKAQDTFQKYPSELRKKFDNNPAIFLDFIQDPKNAEQLVEYGLAQRIPDTKPVEVVVTSTTINPETPAE